MQLLLRLDLIEVDGAYGSRNIDRHERVSSQEGICQSIRFLRVLYDVPKPRDQPAQAEVVLAL